MKKHHYILLTLLCPLFVFGQSVEVIGHLKITEMDTVNTENHLVVKQPDGTLATRMVASLPPPPDTTRTLQSDLLLTSALCNCTSLPPAMIESLRNNGYSVQDLVDFQISIQDLLAGGVSIQELLDAGETPIAIYNSENSLLDSLYGKAYRGGLIAYLNTSTGTGLIAAPVDQSTDAEWGCFGSLIGGTSAAIGTGQANTTLIVGGCPDAGIAARLCNDLFYGGYGNWFLPSKDELNELYQNLNVNGLGGFSNGYYWSSTEFDALEAWRQNFSNGSQDQGFALDYEYVRAVRAF